MNPEKAKRYAPMPDDRKYPPGEKK